MNSKKAKFLKLCQLLGLFHLTSPWAKNKLLILCYHGFDIAGESGFWPGVFMSGPVFKRRLELISEAGYTVLDLGEALARMRGGNLPPRTLAITIDDGLYSTYSIALPLLQAKGYPATVYVTSYYVSKQTPVFKAALQYLFWKTEIRRLSRMHLGLGYGDVDLTDKRARQNLINECIQYGQSQSSEGDRQAFLRKVAEALNIDWTEIERNRMFSLMSADELRELPKSGLSVQLHTHRHRSPLDDGEALKREIQENRYVLEQVVSTPLVHFCYPSGVWSRRQWKWLVEAGIESATTCDAGFNTPDTPKYALKRFLDREDVSEAEFLAELSGFSGLLRWIKKRPKTAVRRILGHRGGLREREIIRGRGRN